MFYAQSDLKEFLNCQNCDIEYQDPRILPCYEFICSICIDSLTESKDDVDVFNCPYCKDVHQIPENGFQKNKYIEKLILKKPREVYRCKEFEELKSRIETIDIKLNELNDNFEWGKNRIIDYCNKLREEINFAKNKAHQEIDQLNTEYNLEVDKYEKECLKKYEEKETDDSKSDLFDEISELTNKWKINFTQFKILEKDIEQGLNEASCCLDKLENEKMKSDSKIFNGRFLRFKDRNDSFGFGNLKYEDIDYLEFNLEKSTLSSVKNLNVSKTCSFLIEKLDNGNLVLCYIDQITKKLTLTTTIPPNMVILKRTSVIKPFSYFMVKNKMFICIYMEFDGINQNVEENDRYLIKCFDSDLNFVKNINLNHNILSYSTYKNKMYFLSNRIFPSKEILLESNNTTQEYNINVYDLDFNKIEKMNPAYNFGNKNFVTTEDYFIIHYLSNVKVMDKITGQQVKQFDLFLQFSLHQTPMTLYNKNRILVYQSDSKDLKLYNFGGELCFEKRVNVDGDLIKITDQEFIFYNCNTFGLTFLNKV
jgi:hypothetical protein